MKKELLLGPFVCAVLVLLANWTTQDTTVTGDKKHRVNFFGTLETQEGNKYKVENISIGMKYKQIYFYEAPQEIPKDLMLTKDPRKGFVAKIDLSEVTEIKVPHPERKLTFKKGTAKKEYVEVVIIFKDEEKTKRRYLIDPRKKIECDEITKAGPIELESLSFAALKHLVIKGYRYREPEQDEVDKKGKARQA